MNNGSTSFVDQLRQDFHSNPIEFRILLPDGSHGIVKAFKDYGAYRLYRIQACTPRGRYLPMHGANPWHAEDELRLFYWQASINLESAA